MICQKVTAWSPSPALKSGALSTRAMLSCASQLSVGVVVISSDARRLASAGWRGRGTALRTRRRTHERENWLAAAEGTRLATTRIMVVACDVLALAVARASLGLEHKTTTAGLPTGTKQAWTYGSSRGG